jgi:hypothetical protein
LSIVTAVNFNSLSKRQTRIVPIINGGASGLSILGDTITESFNTATWNADNDGIRNRYQTSPTVGNACGWSGDLQYPRILDIEAYIRFKIESSNSIRLFIGFTDQTAATMIASDNPPGNYFGLQFSSSRLDTRFEVVNKNGITQSILDSGLVDVVAHDLYIRLYNDFGNSQLQLQLDDEIVSNITTSMPNNTTVLRFIAQLATLTNTGKFLNLGHCLIHTRH